jgi:hypothetical protein
MVGAWKQYECSAIDVKSEPGQGESVKYATLDSVKDSGPEYSSLEEIAKHAKEYVKGKFISVT